jgi:hypothetical protein
MFSFMKINWVWLHFTIIIFLGHSQYFCLPCACLQCLFSFTNSVARDKKRYWTSSSYHYCTEWVAKYSSTGWTVIVSHTCLTIINPLHPTQDTDHIYAKIPFDIQTLWLKINVLIILLASKPTNIYCYMNETCAHSTNKNILLRGDVCSTNNSSELKVD